MFFCGFLTPESPLSGSYNTEKSCNLRGFGVGNQKKVTSDSFAVGNRGFKNAGSDWVSSYAYSKAQWKLLFVYPDLCPLPIRV